jgi:hypothetical protein
MSRRRSPGKRNVRICADTWFDVAENYRCILLGYDVVKFGSLQHQSDERLCFRRQREDKLTDHEADRTLPTNASLRKRGDDHQSPYVFIV